MFSCVNLDAERTFAKPAAPAKPIAPADIAETIYEGGLKPGYQNWGWSPSELTSGAAKVNLSNYGGWIIYRESLQARYGALGLRMKAPPKFGKFLQVKLGYQKDDPTYPAVEIGDEHIHPLKDGWVEVTVPWSSLNPSGAPVDRLTLHAKASVGADWVFFDHIVLSKYDPKAAASALASGPSRPAKLAVDCKAPDHAISPYIYGIAGEGELPDLGATIRRWGGNPTSRYNFQAQALNVGADWFFENTAASDYRKFIGDNEKKGMKSAMTIPTIGWIAKDATSAGFPISKLGPQQSSDQWRKNAGNGMNAAGKQIRPGSPSETSVQASPALMGSWVESMRKDDTKRPQRNVLMYFLDNEPNLWNSTHRDVHPDPLSYDELLDRTIKYASAIRAADPQAQIAGPAEWGWTGYLYSATDTAFGVDRSPDRKAHGDVPLVEWYLQKLREYEKTKGVKLLDVLDLHYYPQANGVFGAGLTDPKGAALRVRSTRSLWDVGYVDESWINDTVRLIPRMKEWIQRNYPGLQIAIGEYNFGGEAHISGALALAEALGRFGTEGIAYAFYWTFPPKNSPAYWAFRAYRNFDSHGGHFLERSLVAKSAPGVSLYASRDDKGKRLVLVALNTDAEKTANAKIALDGCSKITARRKYSYGPHTDSMQDEGVKNGALDEILLPSSINVFDVSLE